MKQLNQITVQELAQLIGKYPHHIFIDLLIWAKYWDSTTLNSWVEDTKDEPEAYDYTTEELKSFIFALTLPKPA